ncbi:MAG: hypothetical protein JNL74_01470, partial [Fibrobacteres bacterium]|nr:hypothetical protein [Fibrobacterota bacterium]
MAETNDYLKQTAFSQAMANDSHLFHAFISRFDKKEKTILPHYHAELEIIIPFNVLGETYCAGRKYPLVHASAHILPPG